MNIKKIVLKKLVSFYAFCTKYFFIRLALQIIIKSKVLCLMADMFTMLSTLICSKLYFAAFLLYLNVAKIGAIF